MTGATDPVSPDSGGADRTPPGGRLLAGAAASCRTLAVLLLMAMSVLVVGQVLGRNLLDLGMPWADELARFCGVALVFLCVPLLALQGRHVAVELVPMSLPLGARRWTGMLVELSVLAFALFFLYGLYRFLGRAWKFATPTLGIPNWVFYAPAIVAMVLLALVTLARLLALLRGETPPGSDQALP
ncbi:TRAP transporter small permease [Stappia sp. WLB 29]|uniref:TRAP transporter small permease n=1 Tax=Stappia sp. WLB 29 TaxID=2925220 RepID=UPI0020C0AF1C|nr:TRAP transporter small permease [Stappia sp. WLB 29]